MNPFPMTGSQLPGNGLDFAFLNDAPAGKHGFVKVKDGHFYFENGTRIRFFGVNLVFGAAMPDKETAGIMARRLASCGINLVRYHHVDASVPEEGGGTLLDTSGGDSQTLHSENFDRLDFLTWELKKRGIYLHIDLYTLRSFLPGDDLDYEDTLSPGKKTLLFYNERLRALHKKFAEQYLFHKNPYTGLRYIDDPAVAIVQIVNENSLFWDNFSCPSASYVKELDDKWNAWLIQKYGSREGLSGAWTREDGALGLMDDEDPEKGTVRRQPLGYWEEKKLDLKAGYESLEGQARFSDVAAFLMEVESAALTDYIAFLKGLGVKCPINASNLPAGAAELKCVSLGEVTENNAYWNHPRSGFKVPAPFHFKEMVSTDPQTITGDFTHNLVSKAAFARVKDKPFVITEWNVCYPTRFRSDVMLMLSAYAALQDWDGLILFSYSHFADKRVLESTRMWGFFNSFNDPAVWGLAGAAASLFRKGLVAQGKALVEIGYSPLDQVSTAPGYRVPFGSLPFISRVQAVFPENGRYAGEADAVVSSGYTPTGNYLGAKHSLVYSRSPYGDPYGKEKMLEAFLNSHREEGGEVLADSLGNPVGSVGVKRAVVEDGQVMDAQTSNFAVILDACLKKWGVIGQDKGFHKPGAFVSDTGELAFNYSQGLFTLDTQKAAAFAGRIPNGTIHFGGFRLETEKEKSTLVILAMDDTALTDSEHLYLTAVGTCANEGMIWDGDILVSEGDGPILVDSLTGTLFVPSNRRNCLAYALSPTGERLSSLEVKRSEDGFSVLIPEAPAAIYYELIIN